MIFKKNLHCLRNMLNRLQAKYFQIRNNVIYNNLLTLDILCKKEKNLPISNCYAHSSEMIQYVTM